MKRRVRREQPVQFGESRAVLRPVSAPRRIRGGVGPNLGSIQMSDRAPKVSIRLRSIHPGPTCGHFGTFRLQTRPYWVQMPTDTLADAHHGHFGMNKRFLVQDVKNVDD